MPLLHTNGHAAYGMASSVSLIDFFPGRLNRGLCQYGEGKKTACRSVLVAFCEKEARRMKWLLDSLWSLVDTNQDPQDQPPIALHRNTGQMHARLKASFHRGDWSNAIRCLLIIISLIPLLWRCRPRDRDNYAPVSPWMRGVHWSFTILYGPGNYSGVLLARDGLLLRLFLPLSVRSWCQRAIPLTPTNSPAYTNTS